MRAEGGERRKQPRYAVPGPRMPRLTSPDLSLAMLLAIRPRDAAVSGSSKDSQLIKGVAVRRRVGFNRCRMEPDKRKRQEDPKTQMCGRLARF